MHFWQTIPFRSWKHCQNNIFSANHQPWSLSVDEDERLYMKNQNKLFFFYFIFFQIVKDNISYFRKWTHLSSRSCFALLSLQLPQTWEKSSRNIAHLEVLLLLMTFSSRSDPQHHLLHFSELRAVPALYNWAIQLPGGFLHFLFLRDFFPNRSIMIKCTSCSQRQVLAIPALVFNNHSLISCLL